MKIQLHLALDTHNQININPQHNGRPTALWQFSRTFTPFYSLHHVTKINLVELVIIAGQSCYVGHHSIYFDRLRYKQILHLVMVYIYDQSEIRYTVSTARFCEKIIGTSYFF